MEIPKYIQNKIKQQIEACNKAEKLEREIDRWCYLSGFDPYSKDYKETKGNLAFAQQQLGHTSMMTTINNYANGSVGMKDVLNAM